MSSKLSVRQILKRSGLFTSREAMEQAVQQQRVLYKQKPVPHLMFHIPAKDFLFVDGKPLRMLKKRYFILNKPKQYTCQKNESYPYVVDLIKVDEPTKKSLFPVGRLDVPSTGLLIITNDGEFASQLLQPKQKVPKTYAVFLKYPLTEAMIDQLQAGVKIHLKRRATDKSATEESYQTLPAQVVRATPESHDRCLITLVEGKYRQVRMMFKAVQNIVLDLSRVQIGGLQLADLKLAEGAYCEMHGEELKKRIFRNSLF